MLQFQNELTDIRIEETRSQVIFHGFRGKTSAANAKKPRTTIHFFVRTTKGESMVTYSIFSMHTTFINEMDVWQHLMTGRLPYLFREHHLRDKFCGGGRSISSAGCMKKNLTSNITFGERMRRAAYCCFKLLNAFFE